MPDTGTSQTIVSLKVTQEAKLAIEHSQLILKNASDMPMSLAGQSCVLFYNDKHSVKTTVLISPGINHPLLIGWEDLIHLHVISHLFPP